MKSYLEFVNESKKNIPKETENYLIKKGFYLKNNMWNIDKRVIILERDQHLLIKNGNLIVDFGEIKGDFIFKGNKSKKSSNNKDFLTSLKGMPKIVRGTFRVEKQRDITSTKYCPEIVEGNVDFSSTKVSDLRYLPKEAYEYTFKKCRHLNLEGIDIKAKYAVDFSYSSVKTLDGIKRIEAKNYVNFRENKKLFDIKGFVNIKCRTMIFHEYYEIKYFSREYEDKSYMGLLEYLTKNNFDVNKYERIFPKEFLTKNMKNSVKGVSKFNL